MPGRIEFEFSTTSGRQVQRKQDSTFVMQVLGDFAGHMTHPDDPAWLMQVPIRTVDLDNINQLWSHFTPRLSIEIEGCLLSIEPRSLDDFHPDQLYRNLPVFEELRQLRRRLVEPASSADALAQMMAGLPDAQKLSSPNSSESKDQPANESGDEMFQRLLGEPQRSTSHSSPQPSGLDRLLQKAVEEHIVQAGDPRIESAVAAVDEAIAETMRKLLRHPQFQDLEGAWRSLYRLVYESELGEQAILRVCNVCKQELLTGLPQSADKLHDSGLYQLLVGRDRRAADDRCFSVLFCNYYFGSNADDIALLASLGSLAELNDAAVIAAAQSELVGSPSLALQADFHSWATVDNTFWQQLRASPMAKRIGLALPRILGRLPYGQETEAIECFEFEELLVTDSNKTPAHDHFLWTNPTLYLAGLLAQSFTSRGWDMSPDDHTDIGSLPAFTYQTDGETRMLPGAEVYLPERSAEAILQKGLMPVVSFRNRDMARVIRFQSIAEPLAALDGPW